MYLENQNNIVNCLSCESSSLISPKIGWQQLTAPQVSPPSVNNSPLTRLSICHQYDANEVVFCPSLSNYKSSMPHYVPNKLHPCLLILDFIDCTSRVLFEILFVRPLNFHRESVVPPITRRFETAHFYRTFEASFIWAEN